mmetsp:Transcript_10216/g.35981  ORF Transcript_10216/g.35981 Transcript_10216/m.35981 type:complete len:91 (+) Transcript_10216:680-952(+)
MANGETPRRIARIGGAAPSTNSSGRLPIQRHSRAPLGRNSTTACDVCRAPSGAHVVVNGAAQWRTTDAGTAVGAPAAGAMLAATRTFAAS